MTPEAVASYANAVLKGISGESFGEASESGANDELIAAWKKWSSSELRPDAGEIRGIIDTVTDTQVSDETIELLLGQWR